MMGITVVPPDGWQPNEPKRTENRLFVVSDSIPGERRRFGYVLAGADGEPPPGPVRWPGSAIVAWKGEPTSVMVINRSPEPTQIHWHGLEIDSYFDGVVGIGGHPGSLTPAIMPADSFEMRITPPRAGSFMYHTHVNDIRQQSAGLYGPFVVLEEDEEWESERDLVFLLSTDSDQELSLLLNGTGEPAPLVLKAGESYRFRLMNITLFHAGARVRLVRDGYPVRWRALAKDGADLPTHQRTVGFADRMVSVGETFDFEWRAPEEAAELTLEVRSRRGGALRRTARPGPGHGSPGGGRNLLTGREFRAVSRLGGRRSDPLRLERRTVWIDSGSEGSEGRRLVATRTRAYVSAVDRDTLEQVFEAPGTHRMVSE